jgi:ABC-type multidrug transport system permease subunit
MLLYLTVVHMLALFIAHLLAPHKLVTSFVTMLIMIAVSFSVGGYMVHPSNVQDFIKWMEYLSPQKWLMPVFAKDEYSDDTIANSGAMQLCRNKHVSVKKC